LRQEEVAPGQRCHAAPGRSTTCLGRCVDMAAFDPSINGRFLICPPRATSAEYEGALVIGQRLVADVIEAAKAVLAALPSTPVPKT